MNRDKTENLKPFRPGQSGNPKGRPKGSRNRNTIIMEWLEAPSEDGEPNVDTMTKAIIKKAIGGDVPAFRELLDSAYGKIADKTELTGAEGGPVQVASDLDRQILNQFLLQQKEAKE
jgi:hypothetical protein